MRLVRAVADWFTFGGIIILAKIAYVIQWISTVIDAIGMLVGAIIVIDAGLTGLGVVMIVIGIPLITFINLVLTGLCLGAVQWLERIDSTHYSVKKLKKAIEEAKAKPESASDPDLVK